MAKRTPKRLAAKSEPEPQLPATLDTRYGLPPFVPTEERDLQYCQARARGKSQLEAARAAGYSEKTARHKAHQIEARSREYIDWLIAHQAQANAKQIAIELEPV